jgi:hypothetical protein
MAKKSSEKSISKVASKKVLDKNAQALKFYSDYRKAFDLIERVDVALGRKPIFKADTGSTLNFEINQHGIASTTAQKI